MLSYPQTRAKRPRANLALTVAAMTIRHAIRPFISSPGFVIALKFANPDDADILQAAVRLELDPHFDVDESGRPCLLVNEAKDVAATGWDLVVKFRHIRASVLLYNEDSQISPDLGLLIDRRIDLGAPQTRHYAAAARLLKKRMSSADAAYLASQSLTSVRLADRPGRPVNRIVRQLQSKADEDATAPAPRREPGKAALEDLSGYGAARAWGERLAIDLRAWQRGDITWADVDRGVLLCGPPGCGKTTFAKALANSCNVELVSASAAEWQALGHLGDFLKGMRKTFKEASAVRPCILFIDEFDSFGDRNAYRNDSHHDYKRQVVNGLLECLDPAEGREGVVVVAATNYADAIDEALLRPGRLEQVIDIPLPDDGARQAILRYHLPGHELSDLDAFVRASDGWSGAEIEKLARDARRFARQEGRDAVEPRDLLNALPAVVEFSQEDLYRLAVHELAGC